MAEGTNVAACLGSWEEEESDDFVFKALGVVRAWATSNRSGTEGSSEVDVFPHNLTKTGECGEKTSLLASSRRFGLIAAALGDAVCIFPPQIVADAAQNEKEDEPPTLLETLLRENPDSLCLQHVDGFCKKSRPIHSVRFTCDDEVLELTGSTNIALYRLRDAFQSGKYGGPCAASMINIDEGKILSSAWHQQPNPEVWMLLLSLRQPDGHRIVRLYDVKQETHETEVNLKQEIPGCFAPIFIRKGSCIAALSATNRLGIALYDPSLSGSQKVVNISVARSNDEADDGARLVSWQLVKETEDTAEFIAISQGNQVEVLQLSIAFTDEGLPQCSFSIVEGNMIVAEEIEYAESSSAAADELDPSVYVETFPPWPVIAMSYSLSPEEHISVLDTSGERWRVAYPSNDDFKPCLLKPQYFDDEDEDEEEDNEVYVRGLTIGFGLGNDGFSSIMSPEDSSSGSANRPGLLFVLGSNGLITVLSVQYLGKSKSSDITPDHCNQPETLEGSPNKKWPTINFGTNGSRIKLSLLQQDAQNEKSESGIIFAASGQAPDTSNKEAAPRPETQLTHAKGISEAAAAGSGERQAETKEKEPEPRLFKPVEKSWKAGTESGVVKPLFGGSYHKSTGVNEARLAINGFQKSTSHTIASQPSTSSGEKRADLRAMPEVQIQQEIRNMGDKANDIKKVLKKLESLTMPSEPSCVEAQNEIDACQKRHKFLVSSLRELEEEHCKAKKSTEEFDQYMQAPELEIQQQILPTDPHVAHVHSIQSRKQMLQRCIHEAQEFFKHSEMKSASRDKELRARTRMHETRKSMHTALLSLKEMIASSNKCLQSLIAIENKNAKYESEDCHQARQGIKNSSDVTHGLEKRHKPFAREAGALTKSLKTWQVEREHIRYRTPKHAVTRSEKDSQCKLSGSAKNVESNQTDNKAKVGPFSFTTLQRNPKADSSEPLEDSAKKSEPQQYLFQSQKDTSHLQRSVDTTASTWDTATASKLGDKITWGPSEIPSLPKASTRGDNESRDVAEASSDKVAADTTEPLAIANSPDSCGLGIDSRNLDEATKHLDKGGGHQQEDSQKKGGSSASTAVQSNIVDDSSLKHDLGHNFNPNMTTPMFSLSNIASSLERTVVTATPKSEVQAKDESSLSRDGSAGKTVNDFKLGATKVESEDQTAKNGQTNTSTTFAGASFGGFQSASFGQSSFNFKADKGNQDSQLQFNFSKASLISKAPSETTDKNTVSKPLNEAESSLATEGKKIDQKLEGSQTTGTEFNTKSSSKGLFQQHSYLGPATKHKSPFGDPKGLSGNDAPSGFSSSVPTSSEGNSKPIEFSQAGNHEPKLTEVEGSQANTLGATAAKNSATGLPIMDLKVSDNSLGLKHPDQGTEAGIKSAVDASPSQSIAAAAPSLPAQAFDSKVESKTPAAFPPNSGQSSSADVSSMEMETQSSFSFQSKTSDPPALFSSPAPSTPGQSPFLVGSNAAPVGMSSGIPGFGQTFASQEISPFGQPQVPSSPFSTALGLSSGSGSSPSQIGSQYPIQMGGFSQSSKIGHQAGPSPTRMASGGGFTAFANRTAASSSVSPFASVAQSNVSFLGNHSMNTWNSDMATSGSGPFSGSGTALNSSFGNQSMSALGPNVPLGTESSSSGFQNSASTPFGANASSSFGSFQSGSFGAQPHAGPSSSAFGAGNQASPFSSNQQSNSSAFTQMRK